MKKTLRKFAFWLLEKSLDASNRGRRQARLFAALERIVPDLTEQYSCFTVDLQDRYLRKNVRYLHAAQVHMGLHVIDRLIAAGRKEITVGDIGDSSGNHLLYIKQLYAHKQVRIRTISVNLDKLAVERIRSKGLEAICCRAEVAHQEIGMAVDIFLCFETLEHLFDPISFLRKLAVSSPAEYLAISVPMRHSSRVGLHHLRRGTAGKVYAENTHIFELAPDDWDLLFEFSGWTVVERDKYFQYPRWNILYLTKWLWRKIDFDGFYVVALKRTPERLDQYADWADDPA